MGVHGIRPRKNLSVTSFNTESFFKKMIYYDLFREFRIICGFIVIRVFTFTSIAKQYLKRFDPELVDNN